MGDPRQFLNLNCIRETAVHVTDCVADQEMNPLFRNFVSAYAGYPDKNFHEQRKTVKQISRPAVFQFVFEPADHTDRFLKILPFQMRNGFG